MVLMKYTFEKGFSVFSDSWSYMSALTFNLSCNKAIIAEEPKVLEFYVEKMNKENDCEHICFFIYDAGQFGEEVYKNIFNKYCKSSDFFEKLIKETIC